MSPARGDARRRTAARRPALRPRLLARRARAQAVDYGSSKARVRGAGRSARASTGRSSARRPSTAPATARRSNCSRWPSSGLVLLPPKGRLSVIHVEDLARLMLALAEPDAPERTSSSSPTTAARAAGAIRHFGAALGRAVGRRGVSLSAPRPLLQVAARLDRLVRRVKAKLTPDRAAYFCHPDWVVTRPSAAAGALWTPRIAPRRPRRDRRLVPRTGLAVSRPDR